MQVRGSLSSTSSISSSYLRITVFDSFKTFSSDIELWRSRLFQGTPGQAYRHGVARLEDSFCGKHAALFSFPGGAYIFTMACGTRLGVRSTSFGSILSTP